MLESSGIDAVAGLLLGRVDDTMYTPDTELELALEPGHGRLGFWSGKVSR